MPPQIGVGGAVLRLLLATTVFETAVGIGLSKLAIEIFLPMDDATAQAIRRLAGRAAPLVAQGDRLAA